MSQPAKSITFAPRARCSSTSGVTWIGWSAISVIVSATRFGRGVFRERPRRQALRRARDERAFGFERQKRRCFRNRHPSHLVELVIVTSQVAADRLHQEVVHGLVN